MTDWWSVTAAAASLVAAPTAVIAAVVAARASTKTTKLAADLAEGGELKKWQRDELKAVVALVLAASHVHRKSVENLFEHPERRTTDDVDAALSELRELELLRMQLWLVSAVLVTNAVDDLYLHHVDAATYYRQLPIRRPSKNLIAAMIGAEYELVLAARTELGTLPVEPPPATDRTGRIV